MTLANLLSLFTLAAAAPAPAPAVRVAAVQAPSRLADPAGNRARFTRLVRRAAAGGARVVVLPEAALHGYLSQDLDRTWALPGRPLPVDLAPVSPAGVAETVGGATCAHFCRLAAELKIYLAVPFVETAWAPDGPRYYNSVVLADPRGRVVGHWRKLEPWPWAEQSWVTPGDKGLPVVETEFGAVSVLIGEDAVDGLTALASSVAAARPRIVLMPAAWVDEVPPADWFWRELPARVDGVDVTLVAANWSVERPRPWHGYGYSTVVGPDGTILATAASLYGEEIVFADLPARAASAPSGPDEALTSAP